MLSYEFELPPSDFTSAMDQFWTMEMDLDRNCRAPDDGVEFCEPANFVADIS
jgi:hypothetical protein